jgi:hypothetical protein
MAEGKPETAPCDWGEIYDEPVTDDDMANAEDMGKVPVGKYLCSCVKTTAIKKHFSTYSCPCVNLKWSIDKVLELEGVPIKEDEADHLIGRSIYDDVAMFSPSEKQGMRSRRILVARRTGVLSKDSTEITGEMWKTGIIGKQVIITYVDEPYEDKHGVTKMFRKVAFTGYDYATNITGKPGSKKEDEFGDI